MGTKDKIPCSANYPELARVSYSVPKASKEFFELLDRVVNNGNNIECPFCHEKDFDLPGLKYHIKYYCNTFETTEDIHPPLFKEDKDDK
jgi:hypothetical protein